MTTWTDEENAIIIEKYATCGARGLARTMLRGRTEAAITTQATLLRARGKMPPGTRGQPEGYQAHSISRAQRDDEDAASRIARAEQFKRQAAEQGDPAATFDEKDLK